MLCSEEAHNGRGGDQHRLEALCESTRGFVAVAPSPRNLRPAHCNNCQCSFKKSDAGTDAQCFGVTVVTSQSGPVSAVVHPVKCNNCGSTSGTSAPEYFCISGGSGVWVEESLLEERGQYYDASNFSLFCGDC